MVTFKRVSWDYSLYGAFSSPFPVLPASILLWSSLQAKRGLSAVCFPWAPVLLAALSDWLVGGTGMRSWRRWGVGETRGHSSPNLDNFSSDWWVSSLASALAGQGCHGSSLCLVTLASQAYFTFVSLINLFCSKFLPCKQFLYWISSLINT